MDNDWHTTDHFLSTDTLMMAHRVIWFASRRKEAEEELLLISTIDLKKKSGLIHHNQQDGPHIIRILIFFSCLKQLRSTRRPAFSIQQDDFISLNFKCVVVWLGRESSANFWLVLLVDVTVTCYWKSIMLSFCCFAWWLLLHFSIHDFLQQPGGFRSIIKAVSTSVIY